MTTTDYAAFLAEKQRIDRPTGFDARDVCAQLFPFQQAIVREPAHRIAVDSAAVPVRCDGGGVVSIPTDRLREIAGDPFTACIDCEALGAFAAAEKAAGGVS